MKREHRRGARLIVLACILGATLSANAGHRNWMPLERYQQMNIIERRHFDKALKLLERSDHKAAAAEFEKFKVQFPKSDSLPYIIFYRGLSLHAGNYRNQAIETYTEVLDYFGYETDASAKSLSQIIKAYADNGDVRKALAKAQELSEDEQYSQHPLTAGALRRLGDQHRKMERHSRALACWNRIYTEFGKSRRQDAAYARGQIANHHLGNGAIAKYVDWVARNTPLNPEAEDAELAQRIAIADDVARRWKGGNSAGRARSKSGQVRLHREYLAYVRATREDFEAVDRAWEWHRRHIAAAAFAGVSEKKVSHADALAYLAERMGKNGDWAVHQKVLWMHLHQIRETGGIRSAIQGAMVFVDSYKGDRWPLYDELLATTIAVDRESAHVPRVAKKALEYARTVKRPDSQWTCYSGLIERLLGPLGEAAICQIALARANEFVRTSPLDGDRDTRLVWLSDQLKANEFYKQALRQLEPVTHVALREFKRYEIVGPSMDEWKKAIDILITVENTNDAHYEPLAREARAQAYKLQLKDFKKAIALFYEISNPPRTLWEIQDCYLRWDRLNDACNTLKEIESMFPTQAARAAWTRTSYYHRQKIRPKTIAEARRILKIYPKTRESSQAHQLLERYGIATGGGVLEDG
jgi:tetratricopeptide (TPR) repeat protein